LQEAPEILNIPTEAFVSKENVTLICSESGWIRTIKGTVDASEVKYKEGDKEFIVQSCQTVDHALVFTSNGKVYTLLVNDFPKGRGFGEPLSVLLDLPKGVTIIGLLLYHSEVEQEKVLIASKDGRGFIISKKDLFAQTKNGKQILNVSEPNQAFICKEVSGDYIAVVGDNRRLVIFKTIELPEMSRGRGVILQKYRGGGISDVTFFSEEEGLSWRSGKRKMSFESWKDWLGRRGLAGRFVPTGFPKSNTF
jgi:topoisomerase-4 subunit A